MEIGNRSAKDIGEEACLLRMTGASLNLEYSGFGDVVRVELVEERWFTSRQSRLAPDRYSSSLSRVQGRLSHAPLIATCSTKNCHLLDYLLYRYLLDALSDRCHMNGRLTSYGARLDVNTVDHLLSIFFESVTYHHSLHNPFT